MVEIPTDRPTDAQDERAPLPDTFAFSQSSLQAFEDCQRRFWLAYVEQLPWPAVEAAPVQEHEQLMRLGSRFHRLVERAEIGIDPETMLAGLESPLSGWFDAYLHHRPDSLPDDNAEVERVLSIPFVSPKGRFRLAAKYDLIACGDPKTDDNRVTIVDWKTSGRRADPGNLRQRLQSIVYPYVLVEASRNLAWGPIAPEQVEMIYWFTAAPGQPIVFRYDQAQHDANHLRLQQILNAILDGQTEPDFPKVPDVEANRKRFCNYCVYRSRCNRGSAPGELDEVADAEALFIADLEIELEFSLDDIPELAF
jgi:hypothetical protein